MLSEWAIDHWGLLDGDYDRNNGTSITNVSLRRLLNITYAYLIRDIEPKEIDNFDARLMGTYVPSPGEKPPAQSGPLRVSDRDLAALDALDSLKRTPNPPTM